MALGPTVFGCRLFVSARIKSVFFLHRSRVAENTKNRSKLSPRACITAQFEPDALPPSDREYRTKGTRCGLFRSFFATGFLRIITKKKKTVLYDRVDIFSVYPAAYGQSTGVLYRMKKQTVRRNSVKYRSEIILADLQQNREKRLRCFVLQ